MPGVESAAIASPTAPFEFNFNQQELRVDGRTYAGRAARRDHRERLGLARLLRDAGHARRRGPRSSTRPIAPGSPLVALINETMAAALLAERERGRPHLQRRQRPAINTASSGSSSNHKIHGVLERPTPCVLLRVGAAPDAATTTWWRAPPATPAQLLSAIRRELLTMEPGLVFMSNSTMEQNLAVEPDAGARRARRWPGRLARSARCWRRSASTASSRSRWRAARGRSACAWRLARRPASVLRLVMRQGSVWPPSEWSSAARWPAAAAISAERSALRHHAVRSGGLGVAAMLTPAGRRGHRQLRARPPRDAGGPDDGAAHRIGARAPPALVSGA